MDPALVYLLFVVCVGGLAIGAVGSVIMFILVLFRVVKV